MNKPYLIYNGLSYIALCTMSEYNESFCPIPTHDIMFIDECMSDTLMDISCNWDVNSFNSIIEERFGLVMDVKFDYTPKAPFDDVVTIESYDNVNEGHQKVNYEQIVDYVVEYDTHYQLNLLEYLFDVDTSIQYRLFLIIHIPPITLKRDYGVYKALTTYFSDDILETIDYDVSDNDITFIFRTWGVTWGNFSNDFKLRVFIETVENRNETFHTPMMTKLNDCIYAQYGIDSVNEVEYSVSFDRTLFKKQLLSLFVNIKNLIDDYNIKVQILA